MAIEVYADADGAGRAHADALDALAATCADWSASLQAR